MCGGLEVEVALLQIGQQGLHLGGQAWQPRVAQDQLLAESGDGVKAQTVVLNLSQDHLQRRETLAQSKSK